MSASEKKAARNEKRRLEELKDKRAVALYTVIGVVVVAAAIVLMVLNSGLLQRNLTALEISGEKYSAADLQFYYKTVYSNYANQYAFDSTVSAKKQSPGVEGYETWFDLMLNEARTVLCNNANLAAKAEAEGFTLTEESQAQIDSFITQLNSGWINTNYSSRDALIKANFGPYMTYDRLLELTRQQYLASDYASARLDAVVHPDSDYEDYYKEHTDELDTFVYSQFTFLAQVPTTDAEGNAIELTDGEKAERLELLKAEQKALAEEVQAKLEGGADPESVAEEYEQQLFSSSVPSRLTGASVTYAAYADWLKDSARKAGDITLTEYEVSDTTCYYYVTVFHDRLRDDESTHTVRHLLVRAGNGSADPTQEEYDAAETKARSLLDEWKSSEATEDSFSALVSANSDDTSSAQDGGLISGITSNSSYVEAFRDWSIDAGRKEGDVELVKTEYGWHIMYYVSTDDPAWKLTAADALLRQDYTQLTQDVSRDFSVGLGISLITP